MKGRMVSIFLTGILTFGVVSLLNSGYIGSQLNLFAEVWVEKSCGSSYSLVAMSPASSPAIQAINNITSILERDAVNEVQGRRVFRYWKMSSYSQIIVCTHNRINAQHSEINRQKHKGG